MKQTRFKLLLYIETVILIFVLESAASIIQYHEIGNILAFVIFATGFALLGKKLKATDKTGILINTGSYDGALWDKYFKRINNLSYLLIFLWAVLVMNVFTAILGENSKLSEAVTIVRPTLLIINYVLAFLLVSAAELYFFTDLRNKDELKKYAGRQIAGAAGFWLIYIAGIAIIGLQALYASFLIVCAVYWLSVIVCNLTLRRNLTVKNFEWKKRYTVIIATIVIVVVGVTYLRRDTFYLQGYINQIPRLQQNTAPIEYDDENGVYSIVMEKDDFKILQLTDIHFGGSLYSLTKDYKALSAVYDLIAYAKPDLVVVTGDLTYPLGISSLSLNNSSAVHQFAAFMRNINVPWVFTFGNHDTEAVASLDRYALCDLYESLAFKTSGTLLYPYTQPNITGRNNQVVELYNSDGSLNQALFIIDSNAYTGEGINVYDYIHDDQVEWYEQEVKRLTEQEGHTVSSMAFFHIPLQQYRTAYDLYESGSDEVTYYFGSNDEVLMDKICCSKYPSRIFDSMMTLGSTKAVFCGHDHYNNMSLEYCGIRLTYGMSIDYLATPGVSKSYKQRGGTLITIHKDSTYDIEQIPLVSIR